MQASLLRALAPFPDARAAVVQALRALDEGNAQAGTARAMAAAPVLIEARANDREAIA
jgi:hypothetical protein